MATVWNRHTQVMVDYNEDNAIIGKNGKECKSFMGTLAKHSNIIPVQAITWREVGKEIKNNAWAEIWVTMK